MLRSILVFFTLFQFIFAQELIIGKYDRVDLLDFNLKNIRAKIDTGAKTSSLHCTYIKQLDENTVTFEILDDTHSKYRKKRFTMPISRIVSIRSSNGIVEKRYVISTNMFIFNRNYTTEFSLTNRKKMSYPILLGREFLENGFIVDVNKINVSFSKKLQDKE